MVGKAEKERVGPRRMDVIAPARHSAALSEAVTRFSAPLIKSGKEAGAAQLTSQWSTSRLFASEMARESLSVSPERRYG